MNGIHEVRGSIPLSSTNLSRHSRESRIVMRVALRFLLGVIVVSSALAVAGCQNPIDPIDKSDEIQGLTWVEINDASLDKWDSDPELDGMLVSLSYKNEFGTELSFHDKPHDVVIEFWTQKNAGTTDIPYLTRDRLFFSTTIDFENSDDDIRIPIEAYFGRLGSVFDFSSEEEDFEGMLVVRVFPPQGSPREELLIAEADVAFYQRPAGQDVTP